jgi:hypothetical protein
VKNEYVITHPQNIITDLQSVESWENGTEILDVKKDICLEYEAAAKISQLSAAPKINRAGNCRRLFVII